MTILKKRHFFASKVGLAWLTNAGAATYLHPGECGRAWFRRAVGGASCARVPAKTERLISVWPKINFGSRAIETYKLNCNFLVRANVRS